MGAVSAAQAGSALNDAQDATGRHQREAVERRARTNRLIAAAVVERRICHPIIDLRLLHNRVFASSLLSMTLAMLALFAVSFLLPFYFEALRGFSIATSGFLLTPLPLTIAVVAPVS